MGEKKTLVIGASENTERYSNMAIKSLLRHSHTVVAIGLRKGMVEDVPVNTEKIAIDNLHTITLYINPALQKDYYDYILSLHPKRIIFNPGTENNELSTLADKNGIEVLEACTLVLLNTGQY